MARHKRPDRRGRILNAAEAAFADLGFEGASLRDIVNRAQVNLPTVYYYFGSKLGLMEAVYKRRFEPLMEQHFELFRHKDAMVGGRPLTVEEVLEIILLPPLRLATSDRHSAAVIRLIGRAVNDPDLRMQEMLRQIHHQVREIFSQRIEICCPHLNRAEIAWRAMGMWGAVGAMLGNPQRLASETNGAFDLTDTPKALNRLVAFFAAAFKAPVFINLPKI